jgi:hypothetical protein
MGWNVGWMPKNPENRGEHERFTEDEQCDMMRGSATLIGGSTICELSRATDLLPRKTA